MNVTTRSTISEYCTRRRRDLRKPNHNRIARAFSCALLLLLACITANAQPGDTGAAKNVLVIYDEQTELPGLAILDSSIRSTLGADTNTRINIFSEGMDLSRFDHSGYGQFLRDYYKEKYSGKKIDVVIAALGPSLQFALAHMEEIAPGTPIVFCGVDRRELDQLSLRSNVTGVLVKREFKGTLDIALRLQPDTRQVIFIAGTSTFDKYLLEQAAQELKAYEDRLKFTYLTDLPLNTILREVSQLPPNTIILCSTVFRDGAGATYVPHDVVSRISQTANVPMYGFVDQYLGRGIVGGHLYSFEAHGNKGAELALRILRGAKTADIPIVEAAASVDMFDARQLQRWNLSEQSLPPGSVVSFKDLSLWARYKWYIIGLVAAVIVEALLIAALLILRTRRRQAEQEKERLGQLAETESKKLNEVVSNVPGIVWESRIDPETGERNTTFISDYAETMLGYTAEEWLNAPPGMGLRIMAEEDREQAERVSKAVIASGREGIALYRWRTKNGRTVWAESYLNPMIEDGQVVGLRGVTIDVTDRKKIDDALRESQSRLLLAHQAAHMGTFEWNIQTGENIWSPELEAMYGLAPGTFPGTQPAWESLVHPDDRKLALGTVEKAFATDAPVENEWRVKWPDGSVHWILGRCQMFRDAEGRPLRLSGINIDITARKEAEAEVIRLKNQLEEENIYLKEELNQHFEELVGESDALKEVLLKIQQVAPTGATVLITGETGTGKELVARAIHSASPRADRPLVKVNCAALSSNLIESELFGHEKGAFTGATSRKIGRFELANGGTIFLDEIGELPLASQVKLLRIIQESEFERLGNAKTIKVDVRIIAATNRDLKVEAEKGTFREDLWYRLNVFPVTVPPLRQRQEDIPLLVKHFVSRFSKKVGKAITSVSPSTLKKLQEHSWPGNIRELANVIERATINSRGPVLYVAEEFDATRVDNPPPVLKSLEAVERDHILSALEETSWRIEGNQGAARILGINPSTLRTRMMKLGIHKNVQTVSKSGSR